jgi:predicted  nucleic acid-binding Zn-ribbon protein
MIEILYRVADLDAKIFGVRKRLEPFRARLASTRERAAAAAAAAKNASERLGVARKTYRGLELDLSALEEKLKTERKKLDAVQSMKAAQAMEHELGVIEEKKNALEEKMLEALESIEGLEKESAAAAESAAETAAEADTLQAEVATAEEEGSARVAAIEAERGGVVAALAAEWLKKYNGLVASGVSPAIAVFDGSGCPGCRKALRPNTVAHLHAGHATSCDHCKRIVLPPSATGDAAPLPGTVDPASQ